MGAEKRYFRIHDLCPGLDGLVAEVSSAPYLIFNRDEKKDEQGRLVGDAIFFVDRLFHSNIMVGDRDVVFPVSKGLLVMEKFLEPCAAPERREYASDNPYGSFQWSNTYTGDGLTLTMVMFDQALVVNVSENGPPTKTVFTKNYYGSDRFAIEQLVSSNLKNQSTTISDVLFGLEKAEG